MKTIATSGLEATWETYIQLKLPLHDSFLLSNSNASQISTKRSCNLRLFLMNAVKHMSYNSCKISSCKIYWHLSLPRLFFTDVFVWNGYCLSLITSVSFVQSQHTIFTDSELVVRHAYITSGWQVNLEKNIFMTCDTTFMEPQKRWWGARTLCDVTGKHLSKRAIYASAFQKHMQRK